MISRAKRFGVNTLFAIMVVTSSSSVLAGDSGLDFRPSILERFSTWLNTRGVDNRVTTWLRGPSQAGSSHQGPSFGCRR